MLTTQTSTHTTAITWHASSISASTVKLMTGEITWQAQWLNRKKQLRNIKHSIRHKPWTGMIRTHRASSSRVSFPAPQYHINEISPYCSPTDRMTAKLVSASIMFWFLSGILRVDRAAWNLKWIACRCKISRLRKRCKFLQRPTPTLHPGSSPLQFLSRCQQLLTSLAPLSQLYPTHPLQY